MKEVKLTIKTTIQKQGESIEQTCFGKWSKKGDTWVLLYKEEVEGAEGVLTTIKVHDRETIIIRSGTIRMRQEFRMGCWTEGKYEGPFGSMLMKTKMERLHVTEERFMLHYRLKLGDEDLGLYEIEILMNEVFG